MSFICKIMLAALLRFTAADKSLTPFVDLKRLTFLYFVSTLTFRQIRNGGHSLFGALTLIFCL